MSDNMKEQSRSVWLETVEKDKLDDFKFYQFWRNINDSDVERFLKLFTKIKLNEIKKLSELKGEEINEAKKILAFEVTKITRSLESANEARDIANNIFNKKNIDDRISSYTVQSSEIKKSDLYPMAYNIVQKAAGLKITLVDWEKVNKAIFLSKGCLLYTSDAADE